MQTRRDIITTAGAVLAAGLTGCANGGRDGAVARAAEAVPAGCAAYNKATQGAVTPDMALQELKEGNARFVSGSMLRCDLRAQVSATAKGQAPIAAVVGCIDSRVPPELVFDQQIGDIFAARVAGNFVNTDIIGSLEFATKLAGAKLIVVLGHSECGAVKGAIDDAKMGNLTATLANIRPSVLRLKGIDGLMNSKNKALVQAVADQNAKDAVKALTDRSEVLRQLVAEGQLRIASAMHDVGTGRVTWFG